MNVKHAAIQVLREAGTALHAKEIAKRILARKLWQTDGKTPHATVSARLYADIKRNGVNSPFVQTGKSEFGLRDLVAKPMSKVGKKTRCESKVPQTYSFTNAAERVLDQAGDKKPMHYQEITKIALDHGWLSTEGKTPEATMYAQVLTEIKRHKNRGKQPRFVQYGRGFIGLSKWMGKGLAFQIGQHNQRVLKELRKRLLAMDWGDFEELIASLLVEMGFEDVKVTRRSGDKGIDVRGTLVVGEVIKTRMAVQVKRWKNNIHSDTVQQVRGSLGTHEQGLIITTSDFSKGAREEAQRPNAVPVALMNGRQFATQLAVYGLGVSKQLQEIFDIVEEAILSKNRGEYHG